MKFLKTLSSFFIRTDYQFSVFLFAMMLATAFIELAGIGSLFPYVKILGTPSYIHSNYILDSIFQFLGFHNDNHFLIFIGFAIFCMIMLKAIMTILNNYFQAKLTYEINNRLSKYCLNSFINLPYVRVIDKNSSIQSKHLLVDVGGVATVLQALLTMMTDVTIALTLIALMIWVDPGLVVFVVALLGGLLFLINRFTKQRINRLSVANEYCNRHAYKSALEALSGLKDIKIYDAGQYFLYRYLKWQYQLSEQLIEFSVVSNLPTNILNVMGFGSLLIILLYLIITQGNLITILPTIGLIAVSVQRLLPSASRISVSIANVRRYKPLIYVVRNAIDALLNQQCDSALESKVIKKVCFDEMLSLKNVTYRYPGAEKNSLENISLLIKKNTALGIVGESGAGKSTLVDVLLGLLPIDSGTIACDDIKINGYPQRSLSPIIAYVPQQVFLLDGSIKENIAFGIDLDNVDEAALQKAVKISQLADFVNQLSDGINTQIGEKGAKLSGGQRQRIGIARALYRDPDILIMDEATNALDVATEKEFNVALKALMKEKTLIVIAHRLSSVQICDEIVQMEQGHIIASGRYDDLCKHSPSFRRIYNLPEETTDA